jgi:CDP-glucose 4,6-dehydratase
LQLAQTLFDDASAATAWNFGPADGEARPVSWIVERLDELWPGGLRWEHDAGEHPHEARYLKVDSSRARARLGWAPRWDLDRTLEAVVEWYAALRDGADMREVTLAQLEAFKLVPNTLSAP